jgi:simple sugar transport system substrate-binding protein
MNRVIRVGFALGLAAVDPGITLDFRVVGNWYDASKAAELASSMFDQGVDVILAIAGGANQGVIAEAKERGRYVLWFDSSGYDLAPGTVVGSSALKQDLVAYEKTKLAIEGKLPFGTAEVKGVRDGVVEFVEDDPNYRDRVPEAIRQRQAAAVRALRDGSVELVMPLL